MSFENILNNNTNLLDKANFNKTMNKNTLKLNEEDKVNDILIFSNHINNRKIFKNKTLSFMLNKRNDLNVNLLKENLETPKIDLIKYIVLINHI